MNELAQFGLGTGLGLFFAILCMFPIKWIIDKCS